MKDQLVRESALDQTLSEETRGHCHNAALILHFKIPLLNSTWDPGHLEMAFLITLTLQTKIRSRLKFKISCNKWSANLNFLSSIQLRTISNSKTIAVVIMWTPLIGQVSIPIQRVGYITISVQSERQRAFLCRFQPTINHMPLEPPVKCISIQLLMMSHSSLVSLRIHFSFQPSRKARNSKHMQMILISTTICSQIKSMSLARLMKSLRSIS